MSDGESDIDTKTIVLPTFEDICLNKKPHSTTHICDNDEHIDIKDLRLYINCFKKQNVNFVEILFTDYYILNPKYEKIFNKLIKYKENIGRYNQKAALNCICGMAYEKLKALEHPYPATLNKIEKYGFDGKQLSHILRLREFMDKYIKDVPYKECLISNQQEYLLKVKRNKNITLEQARVMAKENSDYLKRLKDEYLNNNVMSYNTNLDKLFNEVTVEIMKENLRGRL